MAIQTLSLPDNWQAESNALAGKTILVTGAGDGIGKSLSLRLAELGATIVLLGKTTEKLEITYDLIEAKGYPQAAIYPMNLEGASVKDFEDLADTLDENFGGIDALINNAAMLGDMKPVQTYDAKTWLRTMQVDLNSQVFLTQAMIPLLQKKGGGSIVFTVDDKTRAYWGAYGVAKHALKGLISILAHELDDERYPIKVNGVDPGPSRTNMRAISYPGELFEEVPAPESKAEAFVYCLLEDLSDSVVKIES